MASQQVPAQQEPTQDSVASLNSDGSKNWFIPPYILPAFILVAIVAFAIFDRLGG